MSNQQATLRERALAQEELQGIQLELSRPCRPSDVPRCIQLRQRALTLIPRERDPQLWAGMQGNLGKLYFIWEHGDRADNIERAIEAFEALNTVYTQETNGEEWAFAQFDLAKAYYARLHGDLADNIERAIQAWENALTVFTPERNLQEWATTQNNLASPRRAEAPQGCSAECMKGDKAIRLADAGLPPLPRAGRHLLFHHQSIRAPG